MIYLHSFGAVCPASFIFLSAGLSAKYSCPDSLPAYCPLWCALIVASLPRRSSPLQPVIHFSRFYVSRQEPVYRKKRAAPVCPRRRKNTRKPHISTLSEMCYNGKQKPLARRCFDVHKTVNPGTAQRPASGG